MSDYKVGDKFVIEIVESIAGYKNNPEDPGVLTVLHRIKGFNSLVFDKNGLDKLERLDSDYINENFGELQDNAYEAGRKAGQEEVIKWSSKNETDMYNAGLNDAWELANKILYGADEIIIKAFELKADPRYFDLTNKRNLFKCFTPQEALAKLEAYENEKKFKVGDIVCTDDDPDSPGIITRIENRCIYVLWGDGSCGEQCEPSDFHKVGECNDIKTVLKQIGGESQ